jgi:hypothetical protein
MIWFGSLAGLPPVANRKDRDRVPSEHARMRRALESVASWAPQLAGGDLVQAAAATGWVDEDTARRLLPRFATFDADRYFADHLRRLSFRGASVAAEFRAGVSRVMEDLTGDAAIGAVGPGHGIRFRHQEREGILFAHPQVSFSIGGEMRDAVAAAAEEMPDVLVVVARNFQSSAQQQLSGLLATTKVPGTMLTLNVLLGLRAITLRYRPGAGRVIEMLGRGGTLRGADIAELGSR